MLLKFSPANAKTKELVKVRALRKYLKNGRKVYSLDLLSGWSCPGAKDCLAKVHIIEGRAKVVDGANTSFRCFSASQEVLYPSVYKARKHNLDLLKACNSTVPCLKLLQSSLPPNIGILRFHVGGEFFKMSYLRAVVKLAELRPDVLFYAYTKSLHFLQQIDMVDPTRGIIRHNFLITASRGGRYESLIDELKIRTATVVFSSDDTSLAIDHDDSHAATAGPSFSLLLHGIQPKGSIAAKSLVTLNGKGSYSR
jgi:hypothetical protein